MPSRNTSGQTAELPSRELVARLQEMPAMAELSARGLATMADLAVPYWFQKGDQILAEGELANGFYVVLDGRVKMVRALPNGRSVVLALVGPGDLFGTAAALGGQPCDAAIIALQTTLCMKIDHSGLMVLFEEQPRLISEILPLLTRHMVECKNCIVEMTCYRVETRFAQLLLKLADSVGLQQGEGTFIPVPLSRQELADMTGTTIETCIRVMSGWSKSGVVETTKDGFLVWQRATLAKLAGV